MIKPYICSKCKSELEELDVSYEDMTDGQAEDYDAGFNHTYICPKCKTVEILDVPDDPTITTHVREKDPIKVALGKKLWKEMPEKTRRSESAAIKHFRKEGYQVAKIAKWHDKGKKGKMLSTPEAKRIFKKVRKTIIDDFGIDLKTYLTTGLGVYGVPDLICLRRGAVLFVEVKNSYANICKPKPHQIEKFNEIKKYNIPIKLFIYEGRNNQPDIRVWNRQSPKLFKGKIKKDISSSDKKKAKVDVPEKGQTLLNQY